MGPNPWMAACCPRTSVSASNSSRSSAASAWRGIAKALGVDPKQLRMWRRKGVEPCGGAMLSICRFAFRIPGGLPVILGEGIQMTLFEEES